MQGTLLLARLALLLRRLLHGEEPHPELFAHIAACAEFLAQAPIDNDRLTTLESLVVFRMFHSLGYIGKDPETDPYVADSTITLALLDAAAEKRPALNRHINKALKESHL